MGLSNEERTAKIYFALRNWGELASQIRERSDEHLISSAKPYLQLIDRAWHAFLGQNRNSAHWLMGSATVNTITDGLTPWEMAVSHALTRVFPETKDSMLELNEREKPFDALDYCDIKSLLHSGGHTLESFVFEGYQIAEWLIYSIRRYPDEFSANLSELDKIVSDYQGLAFNSFSKNDAYAKAYVIHEIMKLMYGSIYPYKPEQFDLVTEELAEENVHHSFSGLMNRKLDEFTKWHVSLVKADFVDKQNKSNALFEVRLSVLIDVHKGLYEYKHIKDRFLNKEKFKALNSKLKKQAKERVEQNQKVFDAAKSEKTEDDSKEYHLKALDVYGVDGYFVLSDLSKSKETPAKATKKLVKKPVKKLPKKTVKPKKR